MWINIFSEKINGSNDQQQYRGSSGYKALNKAALTAASKSKNDNVSDAATRALAILGWGNE